MEQWKEIRDNGQITSLGGPRVADNMGTKPMDRELLSRLCCPNDRGALEFDARRLLCAICGSCFPLEHGIPRFLTAERNELCRLQIAEMRARDRSYAAGGGCLGGADSPEFDALKFALEDCRGLSVLDAGCGVGKFSPLVKRADYLLGVDFSWEGLLRFQEPTCPTGLLQADATRLPLQDHTFDVALCCQVLSHLPTHQHRIALLRELARVLKPNGRLVLTVMHYSFRYRLKAIPQEAEEWGTFYHRFEVPELRELLSNSFTIQRLHGYWIYLPKTYWLFMALGPWRGYWDRLWRNRPLSLKYGKYLLAMCSPKSPRNLVEESAHSAHSR